MLLPWVSSLQTRTRGSSDNALRLRGYGEHLLWDEVALAVKPFLSDGRQVLPVSENGKPWYRPHSKNAQSGFQNWFNRLLKRIRMNEAHKEFPRLPFGSLRDVTARRFTLSIL